MLIDRLLVEQVDAIAMRFGYRLLFAPAWANPEYDCGFVRFTNEVPNDHEDDDGDLLDDSDSE